MKNTNYCTISDSELLAKIKLQIKNRWTGSILFEYKKENNTIKDTVIEAVRSNADLSDADLRGAYLRGAYLRGADLSFADLRGADLRGAKNTPFVPFACPSDGAFIGWKKVRGKLVKILIPADAKRCSAGSQKCRCDKALVLAITDYDETNPISEIENTCYYPHVTYKVGEMVIPDSFDEDRWNECSHGIHFFINKHDAINY